MNSQCVWDGRLIQVSVAGVNPALRFLRPCHCHVMQPSLLNLFTSQRSPCPSIISMLERWIDGLGFRMTAREESSLYKSPLGLVSVGEPQGHTEAAGMLTPETLYRGKSLGCCCSIQLAQVCCCNKLEWFPQVVCAMVCVLRLPLMEKYYP